MADYYYPVTGSGGAPSGAAGGDLGGTYPNPTVSSATRDSINAFSLNYWFGSGADGDVTISAGTTTLARNMFYNNLTINGTGSLDPAGYLVFVRNTLDLTAAPARAIAVESVAGNAAVGATGGIAATVANFSPSRWTLGRSSTTTPAGGNGGTVAGTQGGTGTTTVDWTAASTNGSAGGAGSSGAGGTARVAITVTAITPDYVFGTSAFGSFFIGTGNPQIGRAPGAGGGGGDSVNSGGGGGSSGSFAYGLSIYARRISRGASTTAGSIACTGGAGGAGANGVAGNAGGGGGGNGGHGSHIRLFYAELLGTLKAGVVTASGGAGGNGGNGVGTGVGGEGGGGGGAGSLTLANVTSGVITYTVGTAGTAPTSASGATGGTGAVGGVLSVDL